MPLFKHRSSATSVRATLLASAVAAAFSVGCVDKEKCDEAVKVTRDALSKDQPAVARQWRERAWTLCNDATLTATLDKEIVDKEAEVAKRTADTAKQVADAAQARMRTASQLWHGYDVLPETQHSITTLDAYRDKASRMGKDLPPEYAKQIDDYNEREYAKRRSAAK